MTWINARRRYPKRHPPPGGGRRPGRPATLSHVCGVWALSRTNNQIVRVWHHRRTLVSVAGPIARTCAILLELDGDLHKRDWQAKELRKRLRREGFCEVLFVKEEELAELLFNQSRRAQGEFDARHESPEYRA